VSGFNSAPRLSHWVQVKHILRYLNGTRAYGIRFCLENDAVLGKLMLYAFVDSDWDGDVTTSRSTTGLLSFLVECLLPGNRNFNLVSHCRQQKLNITKYVAVCLCAAFRW
jgi:hypothetical protein